MTTEMITTNVIDMPIEQVTEAIVAAAKRVRKPKAEITIVEQIITDLLAGKFAEEAAAHLKQIFGDEFCIKRGLMEKPKKTRKPKATKEPVASEAVVSEPKEKKARKPKAPKVDAPTTTTTSEEAVDAEPKEKKARKPKAPKVAAVSEAPVSEAPVVETPIVVEATVSDSEEKQKKARKPKVPKAVETPIVETSVSEEKKVKKVRKPKEVPAVSESVELPAPTTPVVNTDEFSENWGKPLEDELVEEELSDIEEEE